MALPARPGAIPKPVTLLNITRPASTAKVVSESTSPVVRMTLRITSKLVLVVL